MHREVYRSAATKEVVIHELIVVMHAVLMIHELDIVKDAGQIRTSAIYLYPVLLVHLILEVIVEKRLTLKLIWLEQDRKTTTARLKMVV